MIQFALLDPAIHHWLNSGMRDLQTGNQWILTADGHTLAFADFGVHRRVLEPIPPEYCLYNVYMHLKGLENSVEL